ncbi:class II SORL domain-containing protein [candidate division FCPU426 bacterium]|nr:class II SORL domain-containing protein [candidate division FCPU426 bacterium]
MKELYQSADWKAEKHVPVIEAPAKIKKGECVQVKAVVGKEIAHPNKTEHHIRWIDVYFHAQGEKFPYQIGRAEFTAHGESIQGPDTSGVYTCFEATLCFKTEKPGMILASSYCNIHGLWENAKELAVE